MSLKLQLYDTHEKLASGRGYDRDGVGLRPENP